MPHQPASLSALAEALSPLSHSLAAGLLIRPVAVHAPEAESADSPDSLNSPDSLDSLCADLAALLEQNLPALQEVVAAFEHCEVEETEELADELAVAALELVDMARRIWDSPLPAGAADLRPLLATLAEAGPAQLLLWLLELMHCVIDPWSVAENPEKPAVEFTLRIEDAPLRDAIAHWRNRHPGLLPDRFPF